MERDVLLAVLAVKQGYAAGVDVMSTLARSRNGGGDLLDRLAAEGRVQADRVQDIRTIADQLVRTNGSIDGALQAATADLVSGSTETLSPEEIEEATLQDDGIVENSSPTDSSRVTLEQPGRYEPLGEIGRGAIGRVVATLDRHLGRDVAVKELLVSTQGQETPGVGAGAKSTRVLRFLREARVTARLEHPSIVPVYELGLRSNGSLYYAMRNVKGRTLHSAILESEGKSKRELLNHFIQLCQAIAYAHSKGVVHRDIKPKNIMLGEFGETVMLDWGLAKVLGAPDESEESDVSLFSALSSQETMTGFAVGTPAYMSPEQALGDSKYVDHRSDIWSLGVVLYEMLTGQLPFTGPTNQTMFEAICTRRPIAPEIINPLIDKDLAAICMRCLERSPDDRFQTAKELGEELQRFLLGERVQCYRYSRIEILLKFVKTKPVLALLSFGLALALMVGTIWISALLLYSERHRMAAIAEGEEKAVALEQVQAEKARVDAARVISERSNRQAHQNLSVALEEEARRRLDQFDFLGSAVFSTAALLHTPMNSRSPYSSSEPMDLATADRADEQLASLRSLLYFSEVNRQVTLKGSMAMSSGSWPLATSFVPDGGVAVITVDGQYIEYNRDSLIERERHKISDGVRAALFSQDGRRAAFRDNSGRHRILDTTKPDTSSPALRGSGMGQERSMAFNIDPLKYVVGLDDGSLVLVESTSHNSRTISSDKKSSPKRSLSVSPNDALLASGTEKGDVCTQRSDGSTKELCSQIHVGNTLAVLFTHDSKSIISGGFDGRVAMLDATTLQERWNTKAIDGHILKLLLVNGGRNVLAASHDGWIVRLETGDGRVVERFRAHLGDVSWLSLAEDAVHVASCSSDGRFSVWKLAPPQATRLSGSPKAAINHIALSPDESYLAAINSLFEVCLWRLGRPDLPQLCKQTGQAWSIRFSPDNKWLGIGLVGSMVGLWHIETGKLIFIDTKAEGRISSVDFSPDGQKFASYSGERLFVWRMPQSPADTNPELLLEVRMDQEMGWSMAIAPDSKRAFFTAGGAIEVRLLESGSLVKRIEVDARDVTSVHPFQEGQKAIVTGQNSKAWMLDMESGQIERTFVGHSAWVNTARLSPDGEHLLTGSDDRSFRLWDASSARPVLRGTVASEVLGLAFSSDSRHFWVGYGDSIYKYPILADATLEEPGRLLEQSQANHGMELVEFQLTY